LELKVNVNKAKIMSFRRKGGLGGMPLPRARSSNR
jgi:hypothetical protein